MTITPHAVWRGDIQGLRAVAVLGVVLFHAGMPGASGAFTGVDVFFVISGYLITGNLLREQHTEDRIRLLRFFRNRLARLAPAALTTVALTTAAVVVALPPLDRAAARVDALASLLGVENVRLAMSGTDYLADHAPSPFQQFWSLGVEEQFYFVWALVLAGLCAVPALRRRLGVVTAGLCAVSFAMMLVLSDASGPWAFFGVHTRAWELGAGALVAIAAGHSRRWAPPPALLAVAAPVGLALIATSYVTFDATTPFPSVFTLVPVVGAVLIILPSNHRDPVRRLLDTAPLRWIGDRSYSLYLWHWPALVVPVLALGRPLAWIETVVAVVGTVILAWTSHALLERRAGSWSRGSRRRPLAFVAASLAVGAAIIPATTLPVLHGPDEVAAPSVAAVLAGPASGTALQVPANVTPAIADVGASVPPLYADGCHASTMDDATKACSFGPEGGRTTLVLLGDSHAAQWFSALSALADERDVRFVTMTKSACPSADVSVRSPELGRQYRECDAWRADALRQIDDLAPDVVLTANASSGYADVWSGSGDFREAWAAGTHRTTAALVGSGATVIALQDTPRWPQSPNRCLSAAVLDVGQCSRPVDAVTRPALAARERAAASAAGAAVVDPVPWLCDARCSPVLWNVLAYRDSNHITDELARTLAPRLAEALGLRGVPGFSP